MKVFLPRLFLFLLFSTLLAACAPASRSSELGECHPANAQAESGFLPEVGKGLQSKGKAAEETQSIGAHHHGM